MVEQAEIFYRVSEDYSLACSERDRAYDDIKIVDAELNLKFRESFLKSDKKVTDTAILASVTTSDAHLDAVEEHLLKRKRADDLEAMKTSWLQRSYMLKELVNLYIAGYYSDRSVSADGGAKRDHVEDQREQRIKKHYKERDHGT